MHRGGSASDPACPDDLESMMLRYQKADGEAAALLVDRLSPQLLRFFLAQTRDPWRAEDLLQDFWLRLHNARHTYRPSEPVLPWIYAIARRTQIDDFRRRTRVTKHEMQTDVLPETSSQKNERDHSLELSDLMERLPRSQREIVVMLKVSGLSLEEAARATGSSVGAVKQKAHRAYETLRKLFGSEL